MSTTRSIYIYTCKWLQYCSISDIKLVPGHSDCHDTERWQIGTCVKNNNGPQQKSNEVHNESLKNGLEILAGDLILHVGSLTHQSYWLMFLKLKSQKKVFLLCSAELLIPHAFILFQEPLLSQVSMITTALELKNPGQAEISDRRWVKNGPPTFRIFQIHCSSLHQSIISKPTPAIYLGISTHFWPQTITRVIIIMMRSSILVRTDLPIW